MEASVILFVVMHCGAVEVLIRDTSEKAEWHEVDKSEQERAKAYIEKAGDAGARVITIEVKDDKCGVST